MKNTLQINASFDRPDLLQQMVEQLADKGVHNVISGYIGDWQPVESSSTVTFVSGTVSFAENNSEAINFPFITKFLFTCLHDLNKPNALHWSASLN